jgi:hypothetical protein
MAEVVDSVLELQSKAPALSEFPEPGQSGLPSTEVRTQGPAIETAPCQQPARKRNPADTFNGKAGPGRPKKKRLTPKPDGLDVDPIRPALDASPEERLAWEAKMSSILTQRGNWLRENTEALSPPELNAQRGLLAGENRKFNENCELLRIADAAAGSAGALKEAKQRALDRLQVADIVPEDGE